MESTLVNGLPLPPLLLHLLHCGAWRHPGDAALTRAAPFLREPVIFLGSIDKMRRESRPMLSEYPDSAAFFRTVRGSKQSTPVELPWLDAELAVFVAVNRALGDDLGVALDYRTSRDDPRVVASDWWSAERGCCWRVVAPTFSAFAETLGLGT